MGFRWLPLLFSLSVILMTADAALPPRVYWERMLPNTPIPKSIINLYKLGSKENRIKEIESEDLIPFYTRDSQSKKEISSEDLIPFYTRDSQSKKEISSEDLIPFYTRDSQSKKEISSEDLLPFYTRDSQSKKEISSEDLLPFYTRDSQSKKEISSEDLLPFYIKDSQSKKQISLKDLIPFYTRGSQSKKDENVVLPNIISLPSHDHHDHPKPDLVFLEEGLRPGTKLNAHFHKRKYLSSLLPRHIAERIPFSSEKINEILEIFALKPKSENAENVKKAITQCESPSLDMEEKYCATSMESMVDFVISKLGKRVHVISTEVEKETRSGKFMVKDGVKMIAKDNSIACHPVNYPYVIFLCHKVLNTTTHFMPLEGEDGTRVKAVARCHKDTSGWNHKYIAFQMLQIKPGTSPVCHIFPEGHLLWYADE